MSVAFPIAAPSQEAPRGPSLWELGAELQAETSWIAQLAERLNTDDEAEHAGRSGPDRDRRDRVPHPSDVLAVGSQNGQTDHPGDEHPGHRGGGGTGHALRLAALHSRLAAERVLT